MDACITATDRVPLTPKDRKAASDIGRLERELTRQTPDAAKIQSLTQELPSDVKAKVEAAPDQETKRRVLNAQRAELAAQSSQTLAGVCVEQLPSLFEAIRNPRTLPVVSLDNLRLANEASRLKFCQDLWQEAQKPNAPKEIKDIALQCATAIVKPPQ